MEDHKLIASYYGQLERQGPGSDLSTLKAIELSGLSKTKQLKVADIGCGTGASTIVLAQNLNAKITAIDIFPEFLDILNSKAEKQGVHKKIETKLISMENLPFHSEELDLIWSEGSIYNIGFNKGVNSWSSFLKKGGILAVSEITWLTNSRPVEIQKFWQSEYSEIATASEKIKILEASGYKLLGYFPLSALSWSENYYNPQKEIFRSFLDAHANSAAALEFVNSAKQEINQYEQFKNYYSYGFYIASKL
jgi:SAM-dependent methyltransferase